MIELAGSSIAMTAISLEFSFPKYVVVRKISHKL